VLKTWSCVQAYSVIQVCGGHMFLTLKFCCLLIEVYGDGIMRVQCITKWSNGHPSQWSHWSAQNISEWCDHSLSTETDFRLLREHLWCHWFYSNDSNEAMEMSVQKQSSNGCQYIMLIRIQNKNVRVLCSACSCSLHCCAALAGEKLLRFQRIIVPSSSGSSSHSFPTLVGLVDPEGEGITILWIMVTTYQLSWCSISGDLKLR